MTEERIKQALLDRDPATLEALKREYGRYCAAIAGGILADDGDVEEVVSDVWMRSGPAFRRMTRSTCGCMWAASPGIWR